MKWTNKWKSNILLSVVSAGLILSPVIGASGTASAATATTKATTAVAKAQSTAYTVVLDGKKLALNPAAQQINGTTFVPMRSIFNALGASLTWEASTKTIFIVKSRTTISLQLGSKKAVQNGKTITLAQAPQQIAGATMVPLRFVAEALGADVQLAANHTIRITSIEAITKKAQEAAEQKEQEKAPVVLTTKQIVAKNDSKVVMIMTDIAQGSGVVVGENQILTNYHVMQGASEGSITTLNGKDVEIQGLVGYDKASDLAIIQTKTPLGIDPVEIGFSAYKGDHVVAIGSPLGLQNTVSDGVISNIIFDSAQLYQISAPIDHGSSGGGLFNDYGQLIGITSSGIDATQADLNFAISSLNIQMLLYDLEDSPPAKIEFLPQELPASLAGASTDKIRDLIEDQFSAIQTSQGTTELKQFDVKRDAEGWLVINAVIEPSFYMVYGDESSQDFRLWAINTGYELRRMLPDDKIQLTVYYDQVFSFEPRGFAAGEVTNEGNGKWRVRFPVIEFQGKEKVFVKVRT
ncbi:stalk domain-containing protein [Paenibacillus sp. OV219]|uniref:stalk domain-containing protein n=1 Tax=Paenibacillus sp. OV219 TaxID=1884377 RepID=UPI0008CBD9B1|nr:stalk domain-containing protein [Paenibacillus sp. OV219]SEN84323.1 serine protease, S1-C subfamily, contains C-terminal PDZ domain [Paenibacillus sp. OV219]